MRVRFWPVLLIGLLALTACAPRAAEPAAPAAAPAGGSIHINVPAGALAFQAATATASLPTPTAFLPLPTAAATATRPPATATTAATQAATATIAPATVTSPTPSPPPPAPNLGGQLIYVANRQIVAQPADSANPAILLADPSGTNSGAAPSHLRWSPSGRKLLYTLEPTAAITMPEMVVYDFDAQRLTNLGAGRDPAWSADSERVAYTRDGFGNETVVVKTLATGQEESLGAGRAPAWLPDGGHIAAWRDSNIWLLAYPPGGTATQLTHEATSGPDAWYGTGLLYHAGGGGQILFYGARAKDVGASGNGMRLLSAALNGGALHEWTPPRGNGLVALDISPNARYIAVADQAHSSACATYGGVTIVDTATGAVTALQLPETEERHTHLMGVSWAATSPPRLALAYSEWSCAPGKEGDLGPSRVYLVDLAAPGTLQPQGTGAWPAWNRGREGLGLVPFAGIAH
jgi:hypothetical protein